MNIKQWLDSTIQKGLFVSEYLWIRDNMPEKNVYEWAMSTRDNHIFESFLYQALTKVLEGFDNGEIQR